MRGLRELNRDFRKMKNGLPKELKDELMEAGAIVAVEARSRFASISPRSAGGMRERVRGGGLVVVEQKARKTTGKHPEFGRLQMTRAFLPALDDKAPEVERRLERMIGRLAGDNGF